MKKKKHLYTNKSVNPNKSHFYNKKYIVSIQIEHTTNWKQCISNLKPVLIKPLKIMGHKIYFLSYLVQFEAHQDIRQVTKVNHSTRKLIFNL